MIVVALIVTVFVLTLLKIFSSEDSSEGDADDSKDTAKEECEAGSGILINKPSDCRGHWLTFSGRWFSLSVFVTSFSTSISSQTGSVFISCRNWNFNIDFEGQVRPIEHDGEQVHLSEQSVRNPVRDGHWVGEINGYFFQRGVEFYKSCVIVMHVCSAHVRDVLFSLQQLHEVYSVSN